MIVVSDSNDTRLRVTTLDCKHSMYTTVLWREARCSQRKSSKGGKPGQYCWHQLTVDLPNNLRD